mmetsp:Transcript_20346/g.33555  ORF Transcript_20346/g.33555 Transcript_20346/m.33555 type:complete len:293 (-) Transcript_20346:711-1589(-)|eukprot:CAMPEP_0203760428 /NCGR_PEP_ID=MMETSP0098-20131031/13721_1 /ASSEMBLY_ACC=CAM_ASM_000208 /TAXON_ID=96639 /ORGANISM=" , Strain NY0313808BC1" /LENGTH=292 /DNA_ID=CAMNT_0050653979 /DNA_START=360 /DNA_END=1238 /DNA_ORIENTATION=+
MALSKNQDVNFVGRVVGAASQGAAGALVAACLSSVTEPIVNRVLVNRMSLTEAIAEVDLETVSKFFNTTITTNFIKFPFFEVVNMLLANVELPASGKGAVLGAIFTTATLPITNYRYCKSVGVPVDFDALYKAYLPTVLRDIVYGMCRNNVQAYLIETYPQLGKSPYGRFLLMFFTVMASCVISAPGNEVRGFYLQPPHRRLPVKDFFKPARFVRSTSIGALIMSTALGVGTLATGPATDAVNQLKEFLDKHPLSKVLLGIFVAQQMLASSRHSELVKKQEQLIQATEKKQE